VSAPADLEWGRERLVARSGEAVLFDYVFTTHLDRRLSPRPYFHPIRTPGGQVVTDHRPEDHAWHLGLAYSWPVVDGWNFWGGPTYARDRGYEERPNWAEIRHVRWEGLDEDLEWRDGAGELIAVERRSLKPPEVDQPAGAWWLDLRSEVRNTRPVPLRFGSPTTEGRPNAGYAGLAWRGTPRLLGAEVIIDGRRVEADPMGHRASWVALTRAGLTVAFIEHPDNPRAPNRWFIRATPYALVTSSPVFDEPLLLQPGESLVMRHRLLFADGAWDPPAIGSRLAGVAEAAL
jgi:hypothetical protein